LRGLCATYTNSAAAQGLQRWDVLPDGERLLKMEPDVPLVSTAEYGYDFPITVILNWPALLANR
jgi:hypothetical protein